jgi:hypothetical protein
MGWLRSQRLGARPCSARPDTDRTPALSSRRELPALQGYQFTARKSYLPTEVHWGHTFVGVISRAAPPATQHSVNLARCVLGIGWRAGRRTRAALPAPRQRTRRPAERLAASPSPTPSQPHPLPTPLQLPHGYPPPKRFHEVEPQPGFGLLPPARLSRAVVAGAPRVAALPAARLNENTLALADEMVVCPRCARPAAARGPRARAPAAAKGHSCSVALPLPGPPRARARTSADPLPPPPRPRARAPARPRARRCQGAQLFRCSPPARSTPRARARLRRPAPPSPAPPPPPPPRRAAGAASGG